MNSIAEIVHAQGDLHSGVPNKNFGDMFLLVWKVPDFTDNFSDIEISEVISELNSLAEMAVLTCLKIFGKVYSYQHIRELCEGEEMTSAFPGYKPNLGIGIHYGYAIEGTIGSSYKVDATYISPDVDATKELCQACEYYGVDVIISEQAYKLMSDDF